MEPILLPHSCGLQGWTQVPRVALQTSVPKSDYCPPLSSARHIGDLRYTQLVSDVYLILAEL